MMREFEDNIHDILMEFNDKEELDKKDIDEIMDYHNELRDIVKHNLEKIYDEIPDELDFSEAFYKYMDRVFKKQEDKIDNFIS